METQTHYLYHPVEEKPYIAEAKASKFLNGLQFPRLPTTPPPSSSASPPPPPHPSLSTAPSLTHI